jgi:uncharacterized membrane protein
LLVLADVGSGLYKLFFLLHIIAVLVAFAPAVVHAIMGAQFEALSDEDGQKFARLAYKNSHRVYGPALVLIGFFGVGLVIISDKAIEFSDAWVSLAFIVWLAIIGVVFGMILPSEKKVGGGDMAASKAVAMGGQIATVLLLVMLYLMIWKPGA